MKPVGQQEQLARKRVVNAVISIGVLVLSVISGFIMLAIAWNGPVWVEILVGVVATAIIVAVLLYTLKWVRYQRNRTSKDVHTGA